MNFKFSIRFFTLFLFEACVLPVSATTASDYEIGTWGNFAQGALSCTFDDWPTSGATHITSTGKDAFNAKQLHFTMFISTQGLTSDNWATLKSVFADGHEIASHNQQHNSNTSGLAPSQQAIKTNVPGEMCVAIAYPNCTPISASEVLKYYLAGRTCASDVINKKTPTDFTQIQSKGFGSGQGGYPNDANSMNNYANSAAQQNGWGVELHHGIGTDSHSWATTNLDAMKSHLDYLDKNRSTIWVETFGNVARYIKERDAVSVKKKDSTASSITITVTDNLPDTIFNYPLTIRRVLPNGWTTAVVTQKGTAVYDTIVSVSSKQYVMFKAIPDGGDVVISKDPVAVIRNAPVFGVVGASPVMLKRAILFIDSRQFKGSELTVTLLDLAGKTLARYTLGSNEDRIALPADKISHSAFLARITGGSKTYLGTFIPQL